MAYLYLVVDDRSVLIAIVVQEMMAHNSFFVWPRPRLLLWTPRRYSHTSPLVLPSTFHATCALWSIPKKHSFLFLSFSRSQAAQTAVRFVFRGVRMSSKSVTSREGSGWLNGDGYFYVESRGRNGYWADRMMNYVFPIMHGMDISPKQQMFYIREVRLNGSYHT